MPALPTGEQLTPSDHTARRLAGHQHQKQRNLFSSTVPEENNLTVAVARPMGAGQDPEGTMPAVLPRVFLPRPRQGGLQRSPPGKSGCS